MRNLSILRMLQSQENPLTFRTVDGTLLRVL